MKRIASTISNPYNLLCFSGLCTIPLLVAQTSTIGIICHTALCMLFATIAGKKISYPYFTALVASVVFFHILTPNGVLLFTVARIPITLGAIKIGIDKSMFICSLVFCSLATINKKLALPGRIGIMFTAVFGYFEYFYAARRTIRLKSLITDCDNLFLSAYNHSMLGTTPFTSSHATILTLPLAVRRRIVIRSMLFFMLNCTVLIGSMLLTAHLELPFILR